MGTLVHGYISICTSSTCSLEPTAMVHTPTRTHTHTHTNACAWMTVVLTTAPIASHQSKTAPHHFQFKIQNAAWRTHYTVPLLHLPPVVAHVCTSSTYSCRTWDYTYQCHRWTSSVDARALHNINAQHQCTTSAGASGFNVPRAADGMARDHDGGGSTVVCHRQMAPVQFI